MDIFKKLLESKCTDCGGSGEYRMKCNICPHETLSGGCKINKTSCSGDCPTCSGTGHTLVEHELDIKVPDGYEFYRLDRPIGYQHYAVFYTKRKMKDYWTALRQQFYRHKLPYTEGEIYKFTCEVCGGKGTVKNTCSQTLDCEWDDYCPSCKGNPTISAKCIEIKMKDGKLTAYFRRCDGQEI